MFWLALAQRCPANNVNNRKLNHLFDYLYEHLLTLSYLIAMHARLLIFRIFSSLHALIRHCTFIIFSEILQSAQKKHTYRSKSIEFLIFANIIWDFLKYVSNYYWQFMNMYLHYFDKVKFIIHACVYEEKNSTLHDYFIMHAY